MTRHDPRFVPKPLTPELRDTIQEMLAPATDRDWLLAYLKRNVAIFHSLYRERMATEILARLGGTE